MEKDKKQGSFKARVISQHLGDGFNVFRPVESFEWLLAEKGPLRRGIIITSDLRDVSDEDISSITDSFDLDEILFVHKKTIRQERNFSTSARTIFKGAKDIRDVERHEYPDLDLKGNEETKHSVGLWYTFHHHHVFVPCKAKSWILSEHNNKRSAIFFIDDMNSAKPDVVKSIVDSNEIDDVIFVVQKLLRKERLFNIAATVTVKHAREFNLRKLGKRG